MEGAVDVGVVAGDERQAGVSERLGAGRIVASTAFSGGVHDGTLVDLGVGHVHRRRWVGELIGRRLDDVLVGAGALDVDFGHGADTFDPDDVGRLAVGLHPAAATVGYRP